MSKQGFLSELRQKLVGLPQSEIDDAIEYYSEYIDDAGTENEGAILDEIGTADSVAKRLIAHYSIKNVSVGNQAQAPKRGINAIFAVILAIFAAPIAIPLAAAAVIVAVALAFSGIAVIAAVGISAGVAIAVGIITAIAAFTVVAVNAPTTIAVLGSGILIIGIGLALCVFTVWFSSKAFGLIASLLARFLPKNKSRDTEVR